MVGLAPRDRLLADAGFRVVAPDYRGAGYSSKPSHGYDKRTMAGDIASLLTDGLGVEERVTLVGNDIGMMVAYAFGSEYPDLVERLVLMEAVLPGTAAYDRLVATSTPSARPCGTSSSTTLAMASPRHSPRAANVSTSATSTTATPSIPRRSAPWTSTATPMPS